MVFIFKIIDTLSFYHLPNIALPHDPFFQNSSSAFVAEATSAEQAIPAFQLGRSPWVVIMSSRAGIPMIEKKENSISTDNGGRRSGGDRRTYSYTLHVPERRSGTDRREGKDRRKAPRYKIPSD